MGNGEGVQFSLCKIDYQEVKKQHTAILKETEPTYALNMCDFLLKEIQKKIHKKEKSEIWNVEFENFDGLVYRHIITRYGKLWQKSC